MTGPIKPSEVDTAKSKAIPSQVYEAFNELIAERWDGSSSYVKLDEVAKLVAKKLKRDGVEATVDELFHRKHFDVEPHYRKAGWKVEFDSAARESHPASFTFSKKSK